MADSDEDRSAKLAQVAFGQSFKRPAPVAGDSPTVGINALIDAFEAASRIDDDGVEFWFARDLQPLLGYQRWDTFAEVIQKAMEACRSSSQESADHFSDVRKMVSIGSGAEREIEDIKLTRYACYLIAQNGDPRKQPIAFAQTYFAIQARRAEVADDEAAEYVPLDEEHKRLLLRDEMKDHNKKLASAAKNAGVRDPLDFAIFQTFGYKGLYGGLDRLGIQRRKGLRSKENILDHMGSTELAANLFRATQTEEKLRRDNVRGKEAANEVHFAVGRKVRSTISDLGGVMPENLPPAEDLVKVGRRLKKAITNGAKGGD